MKNLKELAVYLEILSTDFLYEAPKDCEAYRVSISNSNTSLDYFYKLKDGTFVSGDIRLFAGSVIRTLYKLKDKTRTIQYYVDGKLLNEIKISSYKNHSILHSPSQS